MDNTLKWIFLKKEKNVSDAAYMLWQCQETKTSGMEKIKIFRHSKKQIGLQFKQNMSLYHLERALENNWLITLNVALLDQRDYHGDYQVLNIIV